ncbi:uncharacterized protein BP01DRAFT_112662 [Aspergillus saccharolyticus JOP 1030-1]|uniref:Uncharacterized protein n=1 Tax=Aspergillus saccharolyticus JOP 1030-1 TaxID=1450539 RepID=A0A318ZWV2_9EURO|nr:hypothetical protein BP01DRAFT_112662 [Aspergillus saccharolyticus JOP 1030-1]PYH48793.1 hypothetical protein BP01DRAFT_112662 [Aspergillus saccharolyticus JOP 1030-1]
MLSPLRDTTSYDVYTKSPESTQIRQAFKLVCVRRWARRSTSLLCASIVLITARGDQRFHAQRARPDANVMPYGSVLTIWWLVPCMFHPRSPATL